MIFPSSSSYPATPHSLLQHPLPLFLLVTANRCCSTFRYIGIACCSASSPSRAIQARGGSFGDPSKAREKKRMHSVRERRTLLAQSPDLPDLPHFHAVFFVRSRRELGSRPERQRAVRHRDTRRLRIVPHAHLGDHDATSARGSIFTYLFRSGEMKRK